ncbi:MAG: hypothetical protein U1E17_01145 [Geminicoccaceae bacterium]
MQFLAIDGDVGTAHGVLPLTHVLAQAKEEFRFSVRASDRPGQIEITSQRCPLPRAARASARRAARGLRSRPQAQEPHRPIGPRPTRQQPQARAQDVGFGIGGIARHPPADDAEIGVAQLQGCPAEKACARQPAGKLCAKGVEGTRCSASALRSRAKVVSRLSERRGRSARPAPVLACAGEASRSCPRGRTPPSARARCLQVRPGRAERPQAARGHGADAVEALDRQPGQEAQGLLGADHDQAVGLSQIGGELGEEAVEGDPGRGGVPVRATISALIRRATSTAAIGPAKAR